MTEFWENAFSEKQLMWGFEPTASAIFARDHFVSAGVQEVLIPGFGYGRNAKVFLDAGMNVTGIEISETAIELARSQLGLEVKIHHGSVTEMPFDDCEYDAVFCFGLIYLLAATERAKLIRDCYDHLKPGGLMIFTVISKKAPMFGQGAKLADDTYERWPGLAMFFYDESSVRKEFGAWGLMESFEIDEPSPNGEALPFINIVCRKPEL